MVNTYKYPCVLVPERLSTARQSTIQFCEEDVQDVSGENNATESDYKPRHVGMVVAIVLILFLFVWILCDGLPKIFYCFYLMMIAISVIWMVSEVEDNKIKAHLKLVNGILSDQVFRRGIALKKKRDEYNKKVSDWNYMVNFRRSKVADFLKSVDTETFPCESKKEVLYTEFYDKLSESFGNNLFFNRCVKDPASGEMITADYILNFGDENCCVAVVVDVPYSLETRQPENYFYIVDNGIVYSFENINNVFLNKGWIVIRFSEYQVINQPQECCNLVTQVARIFTSERDCVVDYDIVSRVERHNFWSFEQCQFYAEHGFRESYLDINFNLPTPKYVSDMLQGIEQEKSKLKESKNLFLTQQQQFADQKAQFDEVLRQIGSDKKQIEEDRKQLQEEKNKVEEEKNKLQEDSLQLDAEIQQYEIKKRQLRSDRQQFEEIKQQFDEVKQQFENEREEFYAKLEETREKVEEKEEEVVEEEIVETSEVGDTANVPDENQEDENITALNTEISAYYAAENWNGLIDACNRLLELKPESDVAFLRRGSAFGNLGNFQEAVSDFQSAVAINPKNPDAYYNLGIADCMQRNFEAAIGHLKSAVENGVEDKPKVYSMIAGIYKDYLSDMQNYSEYMRKAENGENETEKKNSDLKDISVDEMSAKVVESLEVFDIEKSVVNNINVFRSAISEAAFAVNDVYIAVSTSDRRLKVYSTDSTLVLEGEYPAFAMSFGNKYLALGGHGVLKILDINNQFKEKAGFSVSQSVVKKLFFHPQEDETLFMSDNYTVWRVDVLTSDTKKVINDFKMLSLSVFGDYIIGKDYLNTIKIYTVADFKEVYSMKLSPSVQLKTAVLNGDSSSVILCEKNGKISVFGLENQECVNVIDLKSEIIQVEISSGGFCAVLTSDRKLRLFDTTDFELKREYQLHDMPKLMKISRFGKKMALCGFDGSLRIVSLETAE
ncbi:MAG: tetratricopeptide repeat protein [Bacteroidales bacterium]|nr:tetratricopeptide repeat protein [Bacteroidales bacterium]